MPFTLLLGGARSGKSSLATDLARRSASPVTMVATALAGDEEMTTRIERHQRDRPPTWRVVEEPIDLSGIVESLPPNEFVVVDCLTMWLVNLTERGLTEPDILGRAATSAELLAARPGEAAVVSNEVGMGIVPMGPETRAWRDLLGAINTRFAAAAHTTWLVVAGRILDLAPPFPRG